MALYTPTLVVPMSENYGAATAGTGVTVITPNSGGDFIQLFGDAVTLRFATTGTASVITIDSVDLSNFGVDGNVTVTMGATQVQYVKFDGSVSRFKQQTGNVGYVALTYTSVTGLTLEASYDS
jgi:phosphosulfolactate synthase (CoM biosynthesis protein A)